MNSFLIIGLGDYGHYLCRDLAALNNEILIVDKDESALEDLLDVATSTLIADCTRESVLKRIGVGTFEICFVCIDGNFQSNLEITSLLKDLGARYVVSVASNEVHAKFLLRNGADEIIHPNKDSAQRAAVKYNSNHVFDFLDLKGGYSIYEITPLKAWVDKNLIQANMRKDYDMNVIGIIGSDGSSQFSPRPEEVIHATDHLLVLAHEDVMQKLIDQDKFV